MSYLRLTIPLAAMFALVFGMNSVTLAEEGEQAKTTEPETAETVPTPEYQLIWTGPRTLDTLIDERRDALRDRRMARSDRLRRMYGLVDPVMDYERDMYLAYSDRMRALYRAHRDAMKYNRDAFLATFMPWAKVRQDQADSRRHAFALDSLERQEVMDDLTFAYEPVFGLPFPW